MKKHENSCEIRIINEKINKIGFFGNVKWRYFHMYNHLKVLKIALVIGFTGYVSWNLSIF